MRVPADAAPLVGHGHQPGPPSEPRLPHAGRLPRRGGVLGRLQHGARGHQHRDLLRELPRDAGQRLRRAEGDDPLHQPLGRPRQLPGLPRPARVDGEDRAQDAGQQGGVGPHLRLDRYPRQVRGPAPHAGRARVGADEGQRLAWNAATAMAPSPWTSPARVPGPRLPHERFLFTGERTCIDCHKGIAHRLPDMSGVPGWR